MKVRKISRLTLLFVCIIVGVILAQPQSQAVTKHKIVWQSKVGEEFQIFMMDLDNPGSTKQLTDGKYGSKHPSVNNNLQRIYYYHFFPTNWGDGDQLFYKDLPDGVERLVQRNAIHFENDPSVSRDGKVLGYCSRQTIQKNYGSDNWEIICLKTDFSAASRITTDVDNEMDPFMNGDGSYVYFTIELKKDKTPLEKKALRDAAKEKGEELDEESEDFLTKKLYNIYRNTFDGGKLERVTPRDYHAWQPSVCANDRWMVFTSNMDGNNEIYLMDLESYEATRLTESDSNDSSPCISSDGNEIVFVSDRDGDKEIFSMDRFGKNLVQLTNNDVEDDNPFIT